MARAVSCNYTSMSVAPCSHFFSGREGIEGRRGKLRRGLFEFLAVSTEGKVYNN
jgi:hypothetical protein